MSEAIWAAPPDKEFASYEEFYASSQYARFDQTHRRGGSLGLFGLEVDQGPIDFIDSPLPEYVFQTELLGTRDVAVDLGDGVFERRAPRKASMFFLVPPDTNARFRIDAPHKVRAISIHKSALDPLLDEHGLTAACFHRWYATPRSSTIESAQSANLIRLLDALCRAMAQPGSNSLLIDGLAMQLIASAAADFAPLAAIPDDLRMARAIDYIETYIDRVQAEFIARHFLATEREIVSASLQTEFDADYPWVNRLLPVWKIEFAGDDRLTAYVHTETSSLAAVNNSTKEGLQTAFRIVHTWEWVPEGMDWLRVVVIGLMVGSLFALAATGIVMLVTVRRKKRAPGAKGWHRIAGYVLTLPLIMFSVSGIYHLVQSALVPSGTQLRMGKPVDVASGAWPVEQDWAALAEGRKIASVALVEGGDGKPLYRIGLAPEPGSMGGGEHDHGGDDKAGHDHASMMAPANDAPPTTDAEIREARFVGIKPDGPAIYIDAATGEVAPEGDRDIALGIARRFSGAPDESVTKMELVTWFSHEYDFRNKRLPVWRVDYAEPVNATLFVDTGSGVLVDRVADWEKPERLVFSMIHKWNFLFPIGRLGLNVTVAAFVIALLVFMAVLGLRMDIANRLRGRRRGDPSGKATQNSPGSPQPAE